MMSAQHSTVTGPPSDIDAQQITELARDQLPTEASERPVIRLRFSSLVATVVFSAVEIWAMIIVLVAFRPDGPAKIALACVVAGTAMAIVLAWQGMHVTSTSEGRSPSGRPRSRPQ